MTIPPLSRKTTFWILGILLLLLVIRAILPVALLRFVNAQLDQIPDYDAQIRDIDISLWRGAYVIQDLKMIKKGGNPETPFLEIPVTDLSIEWKSLLYGKVVGEVILKKPVLRFINAKKKSESQLTFSRQWKEQGEKLFPFQLNRLVMEDATVVYEDLHSKPELRLFIRELQVMALNIRNVTNPNDEKLPAEIFSRGKVFESGSFTLDAKANLNKDPEDFSLQFKLTEVDLTKLNSFFRYYGKFDFSSGSFSLFSELKAHDGRFEGYAKPLMENIQVMDSKEKYDQPLEAIWEGVISGVLNIFKNHPKDRFATRIPISGTLNDPDYGLWATVGNVLRNAFVKAFEPNLDHVVLEKKPKDS